LPRASLPKKSYRQQRDRNQAQRNECGYGGTVLHPLLLTEGPDEKSPEWGTTAALGFLAP
jgi:hypothetical protein